MTNEEAINELRNFWDWFCYSHPDDVHADLRIDYAFNMAFDALERCEDVDPYLAQWTNSGLGISDEQVLDNCLNN